LSPYGKWIDYANYGYVWIPDVESDFVPYSTEGHWIMTDYGWSWASDYNWGWATFHYGRWSFTDSFGWFWVPDNEWGPAWVNWRQADGYYGWSPMEPGVTISMSFGNQYDSNNDHWMFVRDRDFDRPNINQYYVNRSDHEQIIRNSRVINNTYNDNSRHTTYVTGPSRNDIENSTGRRIVPLTVQNNNRPGKETNNGRLQIYRPQIDKNNNGRKATPTRITNQNEIKGRSVNQNVNPENMQERPSNQVIPTNNNRPDIPPRNDNNQQNRVSPPSNERKVEPVEQPRSAPMNNNIQERRPAVVTPTPVQRQDNNQQNNRPQQRSASPAKPVAKPQPQRVNPPSNNRPAVQQKSVDQNIQKEQQKIPDRVTDAK